MLVSCTSSNVDRKILSLNDCAIFAELFLQLMCKRWPSKLEKMNQHAEESSKNHLKTVTKLFSHSKFLTGHAIIAEAVFHSQLEVVLFSKGKDQEDI